MKTKAFSIFVTFLGTAVSLLIIISSYIFAKGECKDILINLGFAVFSASLITFIISIAEYQSAKKENAIRFCYECEDFLKLIKNIEYVNIGSHEIAESKYMQLEPLAKSDNEAGRAFLESVLKDDTDRKSNDIASYKAELYSYKESFDQNIRRSMQSYLKISMFNIRTAKLIHYGVYFLFRKHDKQLFTNALTIIEQAVNCINKKAEFFSCYLSNRMQQQTQVVELLAKANAHFFTVGRTEKNYFADEKVSLELREAINAIYATVLKCNLR